MPTEANLCCADGKSIRDELSSQLVHLPNSEQLRAQRHRARAGADAMDTGRGDARKAGPPGGQWSHEGWALGKRSH